MSRKTARNMRCILPERSWLDLSVNRFRRAVLTEIGVQNGFPLIHYHVGEEARMQAAPDIVRGAWGSVSTPAPAHVNGPMQVIALNRVALRHIGGERERLIIPGITRPNPSTDGDPAGP